MGMLCEVAGGAEAEGGGSPEADGGRQEGERVNGDEEGGSEEPAQEHLPFSPVWGGIGGEEGRDGWVGGRFACFQNVTLSVFSIISTGSFLFRISYVYDLIALGLPI